MFSPAIQAVLSVVQTGTDTYADVLFWLNFEANDTTGTYDMGASEGSAGATSGTFNSGATITSTNPKVGTYCLSAGSPDGNDYLSWAISSGDILPTTKGRIGFWYRATTWAAGKQILSLIQDASNGFVLKEAGTDEIAVQWKVATVKEVDDVASTDANISSGATAWHFYEIAFDTTLGASDFLDVYVDGTRRINSVQALTALAPTGVRLGDSDGVNSADFGFDNVMISNDPTRDLYESGTGLSVATSKPAGL